MQQQLIGSSICSRFYVRSVNTEYINQHIYEEKNITFNI